MEYFAGNSRDGASKLRKHRQLWFVPVVNPDGYQYTFDTRAPVAQEPARQRRRRPDHQPRRRRPQPQLPRALGLRRRGLRARDLLRDLPRAPSRPPSPRPRPTSRFVEDRPGDGALLPLLRAAAALPGGLAGPDARARDLPIYLALTGNDANPAVEGFDPDVVGRALHDQRRVHRLGARRGGRARLDARARGGLRGLRLRLPRRRGAGPARVRDQPAVRARPGALGGRSGAAEVAPRQHDRAVLPRAGRASTRPSPTTRSPTSASSSSYGDPQPVEVLARNELRKRQASSTGSTAARRRRARHRRLGRRRDLRRGLRHLLRRSAAAWSPAPSRATRSRSGSPARRRRRRRRARARASGGEFKRVRSDVVHLRGRLRVRRRRRWSSRPRTTPGSAPTQATSAPNYLDYYTDALSANGIAPRRLRRRRRRAARRPTRSACSATTTRSSGTRATTSSPASRGWSRAPRRGSPTTRCSRCART